MPACVYKSNHGLGVSNTVSDSVQGTIIGQSTCTEPVGQRLLAHGLMVSWSLFLMRRKNEKVLYGRILTNVSITD